MNKKQKHVDISSKLYTLQTSFIKTSNCRSWFHKLEKLALYNFHYLEGDSCYSTNNKLTFIYEALMKSVLSFPSGSRITRESSSAMRNYFAKLRLLDSATFRATALDGKMVLGFASFPTVFQSYQEHEWLCAIKHHLFSERISPLAGTDLVLHYSIRP